MDALNALIETLSNAAETPVMHGDAIAYEIARERRTTAVKSLRNDPIIEEFRTQLTDGLIRVDTANKLLTLVNTLVTKLLA
jgi:glycerol-3-phosphate dehydrogenase